uniref:Secreted protein n=1 Tax=Anopheles maculatus TaxID=74869 RepID=A0A182T228_9DIPT
MRLVVMGVMMSKVLLLLMLMVMRTVMDVLLYGNVPGSVIDELAELLLRLDEGLMPGDLSEMSGHFRGCVRLILILLYFARDLGHPSSLGEVDQLGVGQDVRIAFLDVQNFATLAQHLLMALRDVLERKLEPVYGCPLKGGHDRQHTVEVVQILQHHHNLDCAACHRDTLFKVFCLDYRFLDPPCKLQG